MTQDAFILIGGNSSRFGSPKALIKIDGEPLLDRTTQTIKAAIPGAKITLVSSGPDQLLSLATGLPFIFDIHQGRGPLGGLHAALAYARIDWVFIIACDYPFITADLISYLKGQKTEAFEAIVPMQSDGKIQPLCAFYRVKPCLKVIEEILDKNRRTPPLRTILYSVHTRFVEFEEIEKLPRSERFFVNLNTLKDLDLT